MFNGSLKIFLLNSIIFLQILTIVFICFIFFPLSGCDINNTDIAFQTKTFSGESKSFGSGVVTSIIESDKDDLPKAVGIVFTSAALRNLDTTNLSVILKMPQTVASTQFDHIEVEWQPNGKTSQGISNKPIISFRFYIITESEQNNISGLESDSVKMYLLPDSQFIPKNYILLQNSGMPKKGVMFYDSIAAKFNNEKFDKSLIYRYYNGKLIALEIIISKSFLEKNKTFIGEIKQPDKFQLPGFYPLKYNVKFTGSQNKYTVSLINLIRH